MNGTFIFSLEFTLIVKTSTHCRFWKILILIHAVNQKGVLFFILTANYIEGVIGEKFHKFFNCWFVIHLLHQALYQSLRILIEYCIKLLQDIEVKRWCQHFSAFLPLFSWRAILINEKTIFFNDFCCLKLPVLVRSPVRNHTCTRSYMWAFSMCFMLEKTAWENRY